MSFMWRDYSWKGFLIKLILFCLLGGLIWLASHFLPAIGYKPVLPKVTVKNFVACTIQSNKKVPIENFTVSTPQYICADVLADRLSDDLDLTLVIVDKDYEWANPVYVTSKPLSLGNISFRIAPPLPSGGYHARIMYGRLVLAEVLFNVDQK